MSYIIQGGDPTNLDAFARLRVSNPQTIFDSKQIYDTQPLFWDNQQISGEELLLLIIPIKLLLH